MTDESTLRRDNRAVVVHSAATRRTLDRWAADVAREWREAWRGADHRFGHDFPAFLGERFLTDFDMRHHETSAR